jgi:predicted CoA-binding protein
MDTAERILRAFSVLAVVGASRAPHKSAHGVPASLKAAGYRIVPVNPFADEPLFGEQVFPTLRDIPFPIEVVVVFRPTKDVPPIARDAVAIGAQALWLQQGIISSEALDIATQAGLLYVENRCTAVVRTIHGIIKRSAV